MNNVILEGRLSADPELKSTNSGKYVCNFCLAVPNGKDKTDWVDCSAWEKDAEFISNYFHKGDPILITGAIRTNMNERNGEKIKMYSVIVHHAEFTISKKSESKKDDLSDVGTLIVDDEDLPF